LATVNVLLLLFLLLFLHGVLILFASFNLFQTAVLPRPLQHCVVTARRRVATCGPGLRTRRFLLLRPLQHLEMPVICRLDTGRLVPATPVLPAPLQHLELSFVCCNSADRLVPAAPSRSPGTSKAALQC
jgi:hypothetical protein